MNLLYMRDHIYKQLLVLITVLSNALSFYLVLEV